MAAAIFYVTISDSDIYPSTNTSGKEFIVDYYTDFLQHAMFAVFCTIPGIFADFFSCSKIQNTALFHTILYSMCGISYRSYCLLDSYWEYILGKSGTIYTTNYFLIL